MKALFTRPLWPATAAVALLLAMSAFGLWGVRLAADPADHLAISDDLEMPAWIEQAIDPITLERPAELDQLMAELDGQFGRSPFLTAAEHGRFDTHSAPVARSKEPLFWPTVRAIIQVGGERAALLDTCIVRVGNEACGAHVLEIEEERVLVRKGGQRQWIKLAAGDELWGSVE